MLPDPAPLPPRPDRRTPVLLVAGLPGRASAAVDRAAAALAHAEGTVVVRHHLEDLREGVVRRTLRTVLATTETVLELAHGCVSCTLRADLLPLLCTLAARESVQRIVLELDPAFEAEAVCQAIEDVVVTGVVGRVDGPAARDVRIEAVLTCVDAASWLADATGEDTLAERGLATADDDRTVAQVAVGQVDFADALVALGPAPDPIEHDRLTAVLARLVPEAPVTWVDSPDAITAAEIEALLTRIPAHSRRGRVFDAHAPLLRGQPSLLTEHGVTLVEFAASRPFHPARLHDALDVLLEGVVTARGRLWLATQPDEVVWLESAGGGLRVGGAGPWLAAMSAEDYERADATRRALAALGWDERFGDRHISLVILAHEADPAEIRRALHWALVEDDELRLVDRAPERVARWEDPFGEWHEEPCADPGEPIEDIAWPKGRTGEGQ
ncbi:GTP-binding protein [Nocardia farcinica]|uniref:ribosome hibernation factor-recruiting GTPase MRF n=1 Tax=Nocardia farcinica TaxID=37329 RepID=UPI001894596B|nr:GTP-binding protein [Nocardia farcinica]MBF6376581.1 GTP-binding protein [Nocardia farcinica]MBF6421989.1 GTP-binding protein [Nocardia farcinica]MBF6433600.1 GTP-binding protein [Nocardia farcinica]MBF6504464.1 GTP-binding protein [Nocardia farcinica]MBF6572496.1 GTP-binding protein [Nocardia farcinica]